MNLKEMPPSMKALVLLTAWFSLAGPLWFCTLKTHRAALDYQKLSSYDRHVGDMVTTRVPVTIVPTPELVDVVEASQFVVDSRLKSFGIHNWTLDFTKDSGEGNIEVRLKQEQQNGFHVKEQGKIVELNYDLDLLQTGNVADMIVDVLIQEVFWDEIQEWTGQPLGEQAAIHSPNYHIAISVLSGGGKRLEWDSHRFAEKFAGLRTFIESNICNLTVDSQVDYYAHLGSSPKLVDGQWILDHDALSTFVNFAEWNLASTMPYPTLNFVLYIPDPSESPLVIEDSKLNSFIVSQWGGVVIQESPNIDAFYPIFQSQLLTLMGTPQTPTSLQLRLDSLARLFAARSIRAASASLGSLDRLAKNMESIAIPQKVAENCNAAIDYLKVAIASLRDGAPSLANKAAGIAYTYAEAAFFDKHMVSQAFFPDEHKMAVYLPLLAPIALLLIQRWRSLKLFRDADFRKELAECDRQAAKIKHESTKKKLA